MTEVEQNNKDNEVNSLVGKDQEKGSKQFRAVFFRKTIVDGKEKDVFLKSVFISFDRLKESKKKAPNRWILGKESYLYDPEAVQGYDNKGRPIIHYYSGNYLPIQNPGVTPTSEDGVVVNSSIYSATFDRDEMKAVIAASQKEPEKFDRTSLIIGIALGAAIGCLAIVMLVIGDPHVFFPNGIPPLPVK